MSSPKPAIAAATTAGGDGMLDTGEAPPTPTVTTRIELPTRTIAKVILALGVLWLVRQLAPILLQLFIAVLLTAALDPLVCRLEQRRVPRATSVLLILVVLVAALALLLTLLIPPLIDQGNQLADDFPDYAKRAEKLIHSNSALVDRLRGSANSDAADSKTVVTGFVKVGTGVVQGISNFLIVLVMTVYLLVDGERVYGWVTRYLPLKQRAKVRRALPEISKVVSGYVIGQVITSLIFGVYAYIVLTVVGVPQPLLLAIVAAFADAIPIAGVIIATVPAALLALTVSIPAALIVLALYVGYQQVENYLIVPRIYRNTLQISSFAVLLAVLIGAELLGIIGVLLALPLAAAIPVIERIWIEEEPTTVVGATTNP